MPTLSLPASCDDIPVPLKGMGQFVYPTQGTRQAFHWTVNGGYNKGRLTTRCDCSVHQTGKFNGWLINVYTSGSTYRSFHRPPRCLWPRASLGAITVASMIAGGGQSQWSRMNNDPSPRRGETQRDLMCLCWVGSVRLLKRLAVNVPNRCYSEKHPSA